MGKTSALLSDILTKGKNFHLCVKNNAIRFSFFSVVEKLIKKASTLYVFQNFILEVCVLQSYRFQIGSQANRLVQMRVSFVGLLFSLLVVVFLAGLEVGLLGHNRPRSGAVVS